MATRTLTPLDGEGDGTPRPANAVVKPTRPGWQRMFSLRILESAERQMSADPNLLKNAPFLMSVRFNSRKFEEEDERKKESDGFEMRVRMLAEVERHGPEFSFPKDVGFLEARTCFPRDVDAKDPILIIWHSETLQGYEMNVSDRQWMEHYAEYLEKRLMSVHADMERIEIVFHPAKQHVWTFIAEMRRDEMVKLTVELSEEDVETIQRHGAEPFKRAVQAVLDAVMALKSPLQPHNSASPTNPDCTSSDLAKPDLAKQPSQPAVEGYPRETPFSVAATVAGCAHAGKESARPCRRERYNSAEFIVMCLDSGFVTASIGLDTTVGEVKIEVANKTGKSAGSIHLAWQGKELALNSMPVLETYGIQRQDPIREFVPRPAGRRAGMGMVELAEDVARSERIEGNSLSRFTLWNARRRLGSTLPDAVAEYTSTPFPQQKALLEDAKCTLLQKRRGRTFIVR
ncbi:hypothetical protein PRZ48_008650 [Zasmidium cellare]|uniref:Ubiquitin-like domain-containing protein n=1 Tax=Zasmidium cellare TaxID=395010 RepID=A0ABR0EG20_ZASCE|nr:hypothetical protein PRZ48_008650 [Zasmidium cellare]